MKYNDIDLINKVIKIAINQKNIYVKIGEEKCDLPSMKIVLKVLIKQMDKTIGYYETLKKEIEDKNYEDIDFGIYDKMSFLINEFNENISVPEINNVRSFLEFSLVLQKDTYALFVDIQGRFVKNTSDTHTKTYAILSDIINNKANFIKMLERFI